MGFSTSYKDMQDFSIVPAGAYECIITNAEIRQMKSGACKVGFILAVRNDVQQACQGRVLFIDIWRKKDPTINDTQVEGFNFAQLMAVASAAGIQDGMNFESLEQFLRAMVGRCIRVNVTHREYNGETYANVDALKGTTRTQFPECRHTQRQAPQNTAYGGAPQGYQNRQAYAPQNPQGYQHPQGYQNQYAPPAPPAQNTAYGGGFEEVLSDGQVPF